MQPSNNQVYRSIEWANFFKRFLPLLTDEQAKSYLLDMEDGLLPPPLEHRRDLEPYEHRVRSIALTLDGNRDYLSS